MFMCQLVSCFDLLCISDSFKPVFVDAIPWCGVACVASNMLSSLSDTYTNNETHANPSISSYVFLLWISAYYVHVGIGKLSLDMSAINHFAY